VSFKYTFYRKRNGAKPERFAYRGSLVSESDRWLWRLPETEGGRVEGDCYPSWIIAKAKFVIPLLLADFEAYTSYNSSDNFKIYGDLTDFDDEELIEVEAWDQY
jgi:hypothetical protein